MYEVSLALPQEAGGWRRFQLLDVSAAGISVGCLSTQRELLACGTACRQALRCTVYKHGAVAIHATDHGARGPARS